MKAIPYLKSDNFPIENGVYFAGNLNKRNQRLEINKVSVDRLDVSIEDGTCGFVFSDWDFWSDKVEE